MGHQGGCSTRLSTPPRLSGQGEKLAAFQEAPGARQAAVKDRAHHPTAVDICRRPARAAGDSGARIQHCASNPGGIPETGRSPARFGCAFHAQRQRLHATQCKEAVERGPEIPPTAFCKNPGVSHRRVVADDRDPPIMSLWPLMYLVTLWTTTSNPSARGRWMNGVGERVIRDGQQAMPFGSCQFGKVRQLQQWVAGRFPPRSGAWWGERPAPARSDRSDRHRKFQPALFRRTRSNSR